MIKSRPTFLSVLLASLMTLSLAIPRPAQAANPTISINPGSITTTKGQTGGQSLNNLSVEDQSGTDDTWDNYVEFQTPGTIYSGYRSYNLPVEISSKSITSLQLTVNFKGPLKSYQTWSWHIYNWSTAQWVFLGNNASAPSWQWTHLTFSAPAPFGRFVNKTTRQIRIRLQSNNARDNLDLDYESLSISYNTTPTPTASPTPTLLPTPIPSDYWKPAVNTSWQIQYSGSIDTSLDVQVYNLDGADTPQSTIDALHARGIKVMCYFSAGSWENWRSDAGQFPAAVLGSTMNGWPDEKWLDIRQIDALRPIMEARMDMCKSKGFDGIDPDNVDGYNNKTGFPLTYQDQLAYNIFLANAAHTRGLAIGLKNDLDQIPDLVAYFDWQLNEQCFEYNECNKLLPFINAGKPVFNVEYNLTRDQFCSKANSLDFNSLRKHLSLDAYRAACR